MPKSIVLVAKMALSSLVLLAAITISIVIAIPQRRIINGQDSEHIPYVARIDAYTAHPSGGTYGAFAGGTFITRRHVLTQARIIPGYTIWFAHYGTNDISDTIDFVTDAIPHPDFNPDTLEHDIAICVIHSSDFNRKLEITLFIIVIIFN